MLPVRSTPCGVRYLEALRITTVRLHICCLDFVCSLDFVSVFSDVVRRRLSPSYLRSGGASSASGRRMDVDKLGLKLFSCLVGCLTLLTYSCHNWQWLLLYALVLLEP